METSNLSIATRNRISLLSACFLTLLAITNLCHAAIVNINARSATPVELFLEAGTHVVQPIGVADGGSYDAWSPWAGTNCSDPSGCPRTVPTTNTGWLHYYLVESNDITSVSVEGVELTPVVAPPGGEDYFLVTPSKTYYHVLDTLVYPDALTALSNAEMSSFTLSNSGIVKFSLFLSDPQISDNRGGMSLSVNAVPIPPAVWLFGSGLLGLVGIARIKKVA